ncbi:amidohydrolase [Pikeienuella sp. HZG-20]|uniref:amidohydrolase n=1 Tax=Paludibacillus litoralis TaxID=3133267 RepID=UPI0030EE595B
MSDTIVYRAKKIITMDPNRPEATHVAVRDGRILAVGGANCAEQWGGGVDDDRFANAVLMPGLIEGHAHLMAGAMWNYPYVGFHDRLDAEGELWPGLTTIEEVIEGLKKAEAAMSAAGEPDDKPLFAWGFDPIFLPVERLNRSHLDAVSATRPIVVQHSNFHLLTANSPALAMAGYTRETNAVGVAKGPDGELNGELQEMAAMFPLMRRVGVDFRSLSASPDCIRAFAAIARQTGTTTMTDLHAELPEKDIPTLLDTTGAADFPLRIVPMLGAAMMPPKEVAPRALALREKATDMLRLGGVKLVLDGSIQGYTARLRWPYHVNGAPNGIWVIAPEQAEELILSLHQAGVQMHIHTNGDEASVVAIDAIEKALALHNWPDHRHTLQHGQMLDRALFKRMKALGLCANLFANHIWYFGDMHVEKSIGEDRARRMDACRTALDEGVPLAIHSDAPVTPLAPLFTAWCAVNRITMSGRCLGPAQRIEVSEALHAITLGAAYTLKLDHEIGSIEAGKIADFAVLADDPTAVEPMALKDVAVLGVVSGGRVFLN